MQELQTVIEEAFERRADITPHNVEPKVKDSVMAVIDLLDCGQLRVAERTEGQNWVSPSMDQKSRAAVVPSGRRRTFIGGSPAPRQGAVQVCRLQRCATSAKAASAWCGGRARKGFLYRQERRADAVLRQHRRLCR